MSTSDTSDKEISDLLNLISSLLSSNSFDELEKLLFDYDPSANTLTISISLIRYTYPMRRLLKNWNYCLNKIRRHIILIGRDERSLLRGLI